MRRSLAVLSAIVAAVGAASAVALAAAPAGAATRHTVVAVVRPVHADGRPVKGYTVTRESIPDFTCGPQSGVAVDGGIDFCGFSFTDTMACWKSRHHTVLCLRTPWRKELVRIRYQGSFVRQAALTHPVPDGLRLMNGYGCVVRDGGAWDRVTGHPHWYGAYSCHVGSRWLPIYGRGDGIQESSDPWRVHIVLNAGQPDQKIVDHRVAKAFFVGTAS
jgi:hypothetical protein